MGVSGVSSLTPYNFLSSEPIPNTKGNIMLGQMLFVMLAVAAVLTLALFFAVISFFKDRRTTSVYQKRRRRRR